MKGKNGKDYLDASRNWIFRLYTKDEVLMMLRLTEQRYVGLRKAGFLEPMIRRVDYRSRQGINFYTDRQIFEVLLYLHPEMNELEKEYLQSQITEVPDNATFRERRKTKRKKTRTAAENLELFRLREQQRRERERERERKRAERDRARKVRSSKEKPKRKRDTWKPRAGGYTERYCPDRLPYPSTASNHRKDRKASAVGVVKRHGEAESESSIAQQDLARFDEE